MDLVFLLECHVKETVMDGITGVLDYCSVYKKCTYKINLGGPRLAPWRVVVGKMGSVFSQLMWSPAGYAQAYVYMYMYA